MVAVLVAKFGALVDALTSGLRAGSRGAGVGVGTCGGGLGCRLHRRPLLGVCRVSCGVRGLLGCQHSGTWLLCVYNSH